MQAPTAPSGPPIQEPGERACPSCGASNGPLAAFCWQCYRQFAPNGAAPGSPGPVGYAQRTGPAPTGLRGPGYPPVYAPAPTPSPFPEPTPRRGLAGMVGVLVFVVAVAAGVFVFLKDAPDPELPASLGGLPRVSGPQVDAGVEMFRSAAEAEGVSADMAIYGSEVAPTAALVWVTGVATPMDDGGFREFADGFNTGLGTGSLDETGRTTNVVDGVTFDCVPIVGTPPGSMCMWEEDGVFWLVFQLAGGDVGAAQDLAVSAHQAAA